MIGCHRSAYFYCSQARQVKNLPNHATFQDLEGSIKQAVSEHFQLAPVELEGSEHSKPSEWPDSGFVRREKYPWNDCEPDRLEELSILNHLTSAVAPKLEVCAVDLPNLTDAADGVSKQLGVFAKEDIDPGEVVLSETSMLTANNKLQDALCDACSAELPSLDSLSEDNDSPVPCNDCEAVFCSQTCYDLAMGKYHTAVCDKDVEAIAKDVPPAQAADSLYSLLLLRTLAMAEARTQNPLDLDEVKYIWADFHTAAPESAWQPSTLDQPVPTTLPTTLPFSFDWNIRTPFHMLEKMDVNIFTAEYADVWVFNTLYAKFRGTASARLSGLGGRAIRGPEVSAVHPMWCLANHSCDPNVSWEWGGSVKFWARRERVIWTGAKGEEGSRSEPGLRKGDEILNHYCDVDLPVQERREWARGALGGDCQCERCKWEAGEV